MLIAIKLGGDIGKFDVPLGGLIRGSTDDQRRARFIDKD